MKRALVLKAPGTNNDIETRHALEASGAQARVVNLIELSSNPGMLDDAAILVIPGGFSFGDDLGAGKVFALYLAYRLRDPLARFIRKGKLVMGICNGFQVLVKSGFLPGGPNPPEITLAPNTGGVFLCRWCRMRPSKGLFWFSGLPEEIDLPVAHAEGRFAAAYDSGDQIESRIRTALKYIDNPNGSLYDIAGITNPEGNVLGLMPHPERFFERRQHPAFRSSGTVEAWGKVIYKNIVNNA